MKKKKNNININSKQICLFKAEEENEKKKSVCDQWGVDGQINWRLIDRRLIFLLLSPISLYLVSSSSCSFLLYSILFVCSRDLWKNSSELKLIRFRWIFN